MFGQVAEQPPAEKPAVEGIDDEKESDDKTMSEVTLGSFSEMGLRPWDGAISSNARRETALQKKPSVRQVHTETKTDEESIKDIQNDP